MSDEQRKMSDIILSLEADVKRLIKTVSVYDMNTKLILDRVNKIYSYIDSIQKETAQEQATAASLFPNYEQQIIQTSSDHVITMTENPVGHRRTARSESYVDTEQVVPLTPPPAPMQAVQPKVRDSKKPNSSDADRKVPVIQRVTDGTGKDLFMAEVLIINDQKEAVVKTKTNASGKWQAYLKPGMYSINIVKTDTETKKKFEALQDIEVPDSNDPVIIPTIIIRK